MTYIDIIMFLVLIFSGYVFISLKGLKKGMLYLSILLCIGAVISVISRYSDATGKYIVILLILIIGFVWNYKKGQLKKKGSDTHKGHSNE
ncbi:MAG: hypothetical protein HY739_04665 [Desulfobacterales bacterium]|nr:hypothetical protein [Desulfobacterales bacterium]